MRQKDDEAHKQKDKRYYSSVSIEDLTPSDEPWIKLKEEAQQDYTLVDNIMENLNLSV